MSICLVKDLQKQGKVFIISPKRMIAKQMENKVSNMVDFYRHGYTTAKLSFQMLCKFLDN